MAENREGPVNVAKINRVGQIIVAIITSIGVVIVALLTFPPVINYFQKTPTPTSTASPYPTLTTVPSAVPAEAVGPSTAPSAFPVTDTPLPPSSEVNVVLLPNRVGGPPPLNIQINARQSFVKSPDGSTTTCMQSACSFVWSIYQGDQVIYGPREWEGTFSYTFKSAGMYFIKVKVCRGTVCGNGEIQIVAAPK